MTVIAVGPIWHGSRAEKTQVPTDHVLATWFDNSQQKSAIFPIDALRTAVPKS